MITESELAILEKAAADVRAHQHPERGEDLYCLNLVAWLGERVGPVLTSVRELQARPPRPPSPNRYTIHLYTPVHGAVDCEDCEVKVADIRPDILSGTLLDTIASHETYDHPKPNPALSGGPTMGTGNVATDDNESLLFADESE